MTASPVGRYGRAPVYRQIADILAQELKSAYEGGDMIPSEARLARRFSVNRHTLRRAIDELVADGLLERRHGVGTFLLDPLIDYRIQGNTRFTETLERAGHVTQSRVIRQLTVPARGGVARHLGLSEGAEVVWIETVRDVEDAPFCITSHFLPAAAFSSVCAEYSGGSLHGLLLARLGVRLRRITSLVAATTPRGEDASLLRMPHHKPVLRVKSVNVCTVTKERVEYAVSRFRSDRVELSMHPDPAESAEELG